MKTQIRVWKSLVLGVAFLAMGEAGWGQSSITAIGTPVTQDFNTLTTSSSYQTWTDNTTLSGWYTKTDATSPTQYKSNQGGNFAANLYSFGSTNIAERAFGYVPSDAFTGTSGVGNGYLGWRLKNNTGKSIGSIRIVWTGEQWRKAVDANIQYIVLHYQVASSITDLTSGTFIETSSTFASPIHDEAAAASLDGNSADNRTTGITIDIDVEIPSGSEIMLRWDDLNDAVNHSLAIDDISFTATKESQTITFNTLTVKTFGDAAFDLTGSSSSRLTVSYASSDLNVATISSSTLTITGAGKASITASQAGNSTFSPATPVIRVLDVKPQAPTAIEGSDVGPVNFTANWNVASGANGYYLYYGTDPTLATYTAASVGNVLHFHLTNLIPSTDYYYRLKSINTGIYSDYSNIIKASTSAGLQTYDLSATVSFTSAELNWSNGNLAHRAVFLKAGSGSISNPETNTRYYESADWNSKGDELGSSGYYCVYYGDGTSVNLTNLYPGVLYTAQAFEFNGVDWEELYLTTVSGANNPITFTPWPTTTFTNTTPGQASAEDWTTAARWDHATVPTAALHTAVLVYIDGNCEITSNAVSNNLTIKAAHDAVSPKLTINPGGIFTVPSLSNLGTEGSLVIKSTTDAANGTGSLRYDGATSVSGTVERYMTGGLHRSPVPWHLISPGVTGGGIESFVTSSGNAIAKNGSFNYGLAPYNETTNAWTYYPASSGTGDFVVGAGYEVLRDDGDAVIDDDGTVSFMGTLNATDQSIVINYNNIGWNLVGNPFPCALDINAFLNDADNVKSIDQSFSVIYVPTLTNYRYVSIAQGANYLLPPGEGFFVKSQASPTSVPVGTIKFKTSMKSSTSSAYHSPPPKWPAVELVAEAGKDNFNTWIRYIPEMTKGLDPGYDAGLFNAGKTGFALYSRLVEDNGVDFEQQCLPDYDMQNLVVPIGLIAKQNTTINFKAIVTDFPANYKVYLEDRFTGKFNRLDESGSFYSIVLASASTGMGRFYLHTTQGTLGIENEIYDGLTIYPLPQEEKIRVLGALTLPALASVYSVDGSLVSTFILTNPAENEIPLKQVSNGVYVLQIQSDKQFVKRKISWNNN